VLSNSMCVTRSGYESTIYITYESSTGHIGLIVMDAVTETVTSHTLTAVVAPNTTFVRTNELHLAKIPTRSISEVAVLSNGTSVTQFLIAAAFTPRIVHLSWNAGTYTAPTMTLKAGPTDSSLAGGLESLEVRGDQVYHVLYRYDHSNSYSPDKDHFIYKLQVNDATGTGNSWALSAQIWEWIFSYDITTAASIPSLHFSGFGSGYKSLLWLIAMSRYDWHPNLFMGWAYLDFWAEKYTLFSIPTVCKVGRVSVTLQGPITPQIAGKTVTVGTGTLSYKTSISLALTGVQVAVGRGLIAPAIGDIPVPLTGAQFSVQTGALACTISQTLAGSSVTAQRGVLTTALAVPLTGQVVTAASAALTPAISLALTGRLVTAQSGLLSPELALRLSGVQAVVGKGVFQTGITLGLSGIQGVLARGTLTPTILITLAGKTFQVLLKGFGQQIDVNLLGKALTTELGAFGVHSDITLTVSGVQTTGQVGTLPTDTNVPKPTVDMLLWARTEVARLITKIETSDLVNDEDEMQ